MVAGVLIYGFINSAILALITIGFALTFGISGVANFAHGAIYVLAGFATWTFLNIAGIPYPISILLSILLCAALGAGMYRAIILRVRGMAASEIIVTFALGMAILETFRYFGFMGARFALPVFFEGSILLLGVPVDLQRLLITGAGVGLVLFLHLFTHHTRMGLAFRAVAQVERTALTLGIDPDRVATLSMAMGAALTACAAVLILPLGQIAVEAGLEVLLKALAISILAGLGSVTGIFLASLVIGYIQVFTTIFLGPHWQMVATLSVVFIVLVFKPSGLMARQKELEERV